MMFILISPRLFFDSHFHSVWKIKTPPVIIRQL